MEAYKLKLEIKEFILQKTREHPELGCRKLACLIQETFQASISKSTISSVLKSAGLNKVVGRRRIHPKAPLASLSVIQNPALEIACLPVRQDLLPSVAPDDPEAPPIVESIVGPLPLEPQKSQDCGEWFLKAAELCLGGIEQEGAAIPQLFNELVSRSVEVLAIKFTLEDNSLFFLDGAGHSIWSTERIPQRLSVGQYKARAYLNEYVLSGRQPLVLQAVPGFDAPTPALLNFIDVFQAEKPEKAIPRITCLLIR
jgi:hypothetical protein